LAARRSPAFRCWQSSGRNRSKHHLEYAVHERWNMGSRDAERGVRPDLGVTDGRVPCREGQAPNAATRQMCDWQVYERRRGAIEDDYGVPGVWRRRWTWPMASPRLGWGTLFDALRHSQGGERHAGPLANERIGYISRLAPAHAALPRATGSSRSVLLACLLRCPSWSFPLCTTGDASSRP
jgi:hypothetical protein